MKSATGTDDKQAPYMNFAEHQKKRTSYYGVAIPLMFEQVLSALLISFVLIFFDESGI